MVKLAGFLGMTAASWIGWFLTERFGIMTAFIFSTICGGFGMYYAAKWARQRF